MNSDSPVLKSQPAPAIPIESLPSSLSSLLSSPSSSQPTSVLYENGHYSSRSEAAYQLVKETGPEESSNPCVRLYRFAGSCVYRYNLESALYMLDPWEKFLFNSVTGSMAVGAAYLAWNLFQYGVLL